jgi:glycosyltransferase involved in cell wall biosynthesis
MKMKINVLISCMHEKDTNIIQRSNIQTDVVVVNQCDKDCIEEWDFINKQGQQCHAKFINTTERGLSRSRNMAIANSWGDICLICDDDEYLHDGYERLILQGYSEIPSASLIAFSLNRKDLTKHYPVEVRSLKFRQILKTSSQQLTFRKKDLEEKRIRFDVNLGSGTGNGGGEENKFQLDFKRKGLKIYYHPNCIATVNPGESQWFHGYTPDYFTTWGWSTRRIFGNKSLAFVPYFVITHRNKYKGEISMMNALKCALRGWFEKREIKEK